MACISWFVTTAAGMRESSSVYFSSSAPLPCEFFLSKNPLGMSLYLPPSRYGPTISAMTSCTWQTWREFKLVRDPTSQTSVKSRAFSCINVPWGMGGQCAAYVWASRPLAFLPPAAYPACEGKPLAWSLGRGVFYLPRPRPMSRMEEVSQSCPTRALLNSLRRRSTEHRVRWVFQIQVAAIQSTWLHRWDSRARKAEPEVACQCRLSPQSAWILLSTETNGRPEPPTSYCQIVR